jgi:hypothetical protein
VLTASALYRQALPYSVRRVTRVEVFHDGVRVADWLPFVQGAVSAALTSRVTRTLALQVEPSLYPDDSSDLLSPDVAVLKVSTGIGYPDGSSELFPVFTGRVWDARQDGDGGVTVECQDLAADVVGFQFEQPEPSQTGSGVVTEIQRLIRQGLPSAVFGVNDVMAAVVPALVWDVDRGKALDDLAQAVQGRWYALGDGSFVVRQYPYSVGVPVLTLADQSGGTVMTATRSRSRDGVTNSVTVVSERMDGTEPVRVTARDTAPGSPTLFGESYGFVSKTIKVQTPLSTVQAQQLAIAQLTAAVALTEQWSISCVADSTIEPGDTLAVEYRGASSVQVVDSITYPLGTDAPMQMNTRSSILAPVTT